MKLSCLQENLSKALGIVGHAVATRSTLPITQNILMSTDQGRLKLSATNLEIAMTTWVGAKISDEGAVTVPARLLADFVTSLPQGQVEIAMIPKPRGIQVTCGRFEGRIMGTDPEEFPPIPSVQEGVGVTVPSQQLRQAINRVVFAAATEDSRPVLTGVKVELEGNKMTLAAADGFRLAVHGASLGSPVSEDTDFIIPARTLTELNRLLGDQTEAVEFTVTPQRSQALFRLQNVELVTQLVQGAFPNYRQLIPQSYGTRTIVSLKEFLQASHAASIFARDGGGIVRVQVIPGTGGGSGKLVVSARAEEVGDNQGEIDAVVEGPETKIAFSSKYLSDVLSILDEKGEVALETTTSSSPGVFRSVVDDGYVHVIMPMFVQW
ncbi:MAG: DNA polymerase III subunit beta [SAR202 cluster bacterium Io17-Chloro-G3]|nr:MAG: DNA polymerase III subunit beta [SAR202 cluster bacterium Io17-Chloro-G3]